MMIFFFYFSWQCKYLQLEKTSGFKIEMPIKKYWQSIYSRVWQKGPPGSDRVKEITEEMLDS